MTLEGRGVLDLKGNVVDAAINCALSSPFNSGRVEIDTNDPAWGDGRD